MIEGDVLGILLYLEFGLLHTQLTQKESQILHFGTPSARRFCETLCGRPVHLAPRDRAWAHSPRDGECAEVLRPARLQRGRPQSCAQNSRSRRRAAPSARMVAEVHPACENEGARDGMRAAHVARTPRQHIAPPRALVDDRVTTPCPHGARRAMSGVL